ncbi:MAG: hypothetical protein ACLFTT_14545 [Candidatus Hydrogenedentota bacterium]
METPQTSEILATRRNARRAARVFLTSNCVYLLVVYVWSLGLGPVGADHVLLGGADSPAVVRVLYALLGGFHLGYQVVNLLLLYGCMAAVFFLTNALVRGPVWMGSLAMALLMAHPVKSDAVLPLTSTPLLGANLLVLAGMACYAAHTRCGGTVLYALAVALFVPSLCVPAMAGAALVPLVIEFVALPREARRCWRPTPFFALAVVNAIVHTHHFDAAGMFAPLAVIGYPIGFLPETAAGLSEQPLLGWVAGGAVVVVLGGLAWALRSRAFVFALLAMALVRLGNGGQFVDPYHLLGGGQLFLSIAMANIAFAAFCRRVIQHPKWHRPIVVMTTVLCLVFFGMQIRTIFAWRHAAGIVERAQAAAKEVLRETPDATFGLLPAYRAYEGAPVMLEEAIGAQVGEDRVRPLLRVHVPKAGVDAAVVTAYESKHAVVRLENVRPLAVLPWPYTLEAAAGEDTEVSPLPGGEEEGGVRVRVTPATGVFPPHVLPPSAFD